MGRKPEDRRSQRMRLLRPEHSRRKRVIRRKDLLASVGTNAEWERKMSDLDLEMALAEEGKGFWGRSFSRFDGMAEVL